MKLTDIHNRETEIRDAAHLESLFAETPDIDGYGAFMIYTTVGEPELWLHFNDDIAYPHYFPTSDGSHPGWQPESEERPEHEDPKELAYVAFRADASDAPKADGKQLKGQWDLASKTWDGDPDAVRTGFKRPGVPQPRSSLILKQIFQPCARCTRSPKVPPLATTPSPLWS